MQKDKRGAGLCLSLIERQRAGRKLRARELPLGRSAKRSVARPIRDGSKFPDAIVGNRIE